MAPVASTAGHTVQNFLVLVVFLSKVAVIPKNSRRREVKETRFVLVNLKSLYVMLLERSFSSILNIDKYKCFTVKKFSRYWGDELDKNKPSVLPRALKS